MCIRAITHKAPSTIWYATVSAFFIDQYHKKNRQNRRTVNRAKDKEIIPLQVQLSSHLAQQDTGGPAG